MEENKIFTKIKELGHVNSKRDELREYCKLKIDHILNFLPRRILNSDGGDLLDCLLNGTMDKLTSSNNKVKSARIQIIDIVLKVMRKESTSLTHCGDVVSRLCLELPRLPPSDLVRWTDDSVQTIVEDKDVNMIWKDVLPECLNALSAATTVVRCGTEMPFQEYKEQCVHTLCQCQWKDKQLVQLTAMFRELQLARADHKQVVNKLCSHLAELPPDSVPPLVHQLVKLCKVYHMEVVLYHVSQYFNVRLYAALEPQPDSEATTVDCDIAQHSPGELSGCLSTCLYHLSAGAVEPELMRKHLKAWPRTHLLRNPFLVDLALALSDKGADFKAVCLDLIKASIESRVADEARRAESAWSRAQLPPDVNVASLLKQLTTESANHRQLTVPGLIDLAFVLLGVARTRPGASTLWGYGKLILARLCKAQPETAPAVLSKLADRLASHPASKHYADCLHVLCALAPVSIERCPQLTWILESWGDPGVLDAVNPLLGFSTRLRDTLVMVCRKGLYSREGEQRRAALAGLLTVLRHARVSRGACSQGAASEHFSAYSYLTQAVDVHASQAGLVTSRVRNEAMCMEVVSILRRCLGQDAAVKELLYSKLYDCAKEKTVLHESILELLYEHLNKYLPEDDTADGGSLLYDQCVLVTPLTATLKEPLSRLLYVTAQFLQPTEEEELEDILASQSGDTASAHLRSKLTSMLDKLCRAGIVAIQLSEEPGLTDLTPESKAKALKVQQMVSCLEALVAHQVMQWNRLSENNADVIYQLFKASNSLTEQIKASPKIGKKGSKSTLNETRETVKSQKSQKSQKDKGKGPATKVSNLVKDRAGPFKPLPCIWDLKFCLRILELLYSDDVNWCSPAQRNIILSKREFHQWAVRCFTSVVAEVTEKRSARVLAEIAGLLFKRIICRFREMCDFDDQTALACLDLFKETLTVLLSPQLSLKLESFLPTITDLDEEATTSLCMANILEKLHTSLVHIEEESVPEERDSVVKKLVVSLVQTTALLLEVHVPPSVETSTVLLKLEDWVRSSKQDCLPLVPALLTAASRELKEAPFLEDLLLKLSAALGRIDEEDTSAGEDPGTFPAIDARSGHAALAHVCAHLLARHRGIEHLLQRCRHLTVAAELAPDTAARRLHRELNETYRSVMIQLCLVAAWTMAAAKLRCTVGGGSERVLAACVRLYALLAALARQITPPVDRRFERLLKVCGKKLSSVTDNLITYLEASQQPQTASKVLRDTKLIPRLVLEAELFTKYVIILANKTKQNYQQYLSLGTARDFRIKGPVLQEVLLARRDDRNQDGEDGINDAVTEILTAENEGGQEKDDNEDAEEDTSRRKRRRVS